MSDYSNSLGGAAKDAANDTILAADYDTQFDAVAVASATKANKVASATNGNVVTMDANGDLVDGAVNSTEIAILDGATLTTAELNILDGVTSTAAELNKLDGATLTTTELNYVDGVTSSIQTQLDTPAGSRHFGFKGAYSPTSNLLVEVVPTFSGTEVDPNGEFSPGTGRYTPQVAGTYFFTVTSQVSHVTGAGAPQDWTVGVRENGSTYLAEFDPGSAIMVYINRGSIALSGLFVANGSTDYISMFMDRGSSSENMSLADYNFSAFRISA